MQNQFQENDLFLNAFQYAPIGIALVDPDGAWIKVNPSLCKLLGYREDELLSTTFQALSHPDDLQRDLKLVEQMIKGEIDSYQLEKRYFHKQGHIVWALLSVSLVHNSDGSPRYFISQVLDVSKLKMAERKINELTDKNLSLLDTIADAFYSLDEELRFVYMNKEAERQLGKKNEDLQGKLLWDEFPQLENTDYGDCFRSALHEHITITFEECIPATLKTKEKWLETHIYPTQYGLSVYFQDVTDRKETEDKLRESEEWFRMLADYSTDMISRHSAKGICTYVSAISYTLLGYKPSELIGKKLYDWLHPDDLTEFKDSFESIMTTQQISTVSFRVRRKDGTYIWFESTIRSIRDKRGRILEIIAVSRDITERKVTEMKMQEANDILMRLSITDGLTGIANRRSFDLTMEREWGVAARYRQSLSLLLCDIDFFKAYNDTYGHQGGDHCLQLVANALKKALNRPNDFAARYGGEEFAIILPNTDKQGAAKVSRSIKQWIEDLQIPHVSSRVSHIVTVSIGVATVIPSATLSINTLIEYTDKALYLAKQGGRNRVVVAGDK